jgi:Glu-tRNA(Gln) amidotransferase subunit E-like FAD-binding protein
MLHPIAGKKAKEVAAKIGPLLRHNSERLLGLGDARDDLALSGWSSTTRMRLLMPLPPAAQRPPEA